MSSIYTAVLPSYDSFFERAGMNVSASPDIACDYIFMGTETPSAIATMQAYASKHNKQLPGLSLVNKDNANLIFQQSGFDTVFTVCPMSKTDIESFPSEQVILKPANGSNTRSISGVSIFDQIAYCVVAKTTLLELINMDESFWQIQAEQAYFVIQEAVPTLDGNTKYATLFLSGAINGSGEVFHSAPIVGERTYKNKVRVSSSTWSSEHTNTIIEAIQTKLETMVVNSEVRNAFYQMQFLGNGTIWNPIDFQFRMPYHSILGLQALGNDSYIVDLIKYTYDLSTEKPVQPFVTCIHISPNNLNPTNEIKRWAKGNTKDEAITAMQEQLKEGVSL